METPAPPDAAAADPYAPGRAPPAEPRRGVTPPGSALVFLWAIAGLSIAGPGELWQPWARSLLAEGVPHSVRSVGIYGSLLILPALLGPLLAYLADRVPVLESRREGYLVVASLLALVAWLGAAFATLDFGATVAIGLTLTASSGFSFAVIGGALAEIGRRHHRWGRLSAARFGIISLSGLVGEPLYTFLFQRPIAWTGGAGAAVALSIVVLAFLALERSTQAPGLPPEPAPEPVKLLRWLGTRAFWGTLLVLVTAAIPQLAYARFNRYVEVVLRLSDDEATRAYLAGSIGSVAAAGAYWLASQRLPLRKLLPALIVLEGVAMLTVDDAGRWVGTFLLTRAVIGFAAGLTACARFDLLLRAVPAGREAFGFSLVMGLSVMVTSLTSPFAAMAAHDQGPDFRSLFLAAGALTVLSAAAVLMLPRALVDSPDGGNRAAA